MKIWVAMVVIPTKELSRSIIQDWRNYASSITSDGWLRSVLRPVVRPKSAAPPWIYDDSKFWRKHGQYRYAHTLLRIHSHIWNSKNSVSHLKRTIYTLKIWGLHGKYENFSSDSRFLIRVLSMKPYVNITKLITSPISKFGRTDNWVSQNSGLL